jgi:hypothetical protein
MGDQKVELRHLLLDVADMAAQSLNEETSEYTFMHAYSTGPEICQKLLFRKILNITSWDVCFNPFYKWSYACNITVHETDASDLTQHEYHLHLFECLHIAERVVLDMGAAIDETSLKCELAQMIVERIRPYMNENQAAKIMQYDTKVELRNMLRNASAMAVDQLNEEYQTKVHFQYTTSRGCHQRIICNNIRKTKSWLWPQTYHTACKISPKQVNTHDLTKLDYCLQLFSVDNIVLDKRGAADAITLKHVIAKAIVDAVKSRIAKEQNPAWDSLLQCMYAMDRNEGSRL